MQDYQKLNVWQALSSAVCEVKQMLTALIRKVKATKTPRAVAVTRTN